MTTISLYPTSGKFEKNWSFFTQFAPYGSTTCCPLAFTITNALIKNPLSKAQLLQTRSDWGKWRSKFRKFPASLLCQCPPARRSTPTSSYTHSSYFTILYTTASPQRPSAIIDNEPAKSQMEILFDLHKNYTRFASFFCIFTSHVRLLWLNNYLVHSTAWCWGWGDE